MEYSAWCINNLANIQKEVEGGSVVERLNLEQAIYFRSIFL